MLRRLYVYDIVEYIIHYSDVPMSKLPASRLFTKHRKCFNLMTSSWSKFCKFGRLVWILFNELGQKYCMSSWAINTASGNILRPRGNGQHFADDIFKRISFCANAWLSIEIPLKFVSKDLINNIQALVQIMARRYYLNQWWLISRRIYAALGLDKLR